MRDLNIHLWWLRHFVCSALEGVLQVSFAIFAPEVKIETSVWSDHSDLLQIPQYFGSVPRL